MFFLNHDVTKYLTVLKILRTYNSIHFLTKATRFHS